MPNPGNRFADNRNHKNILKARKMFILMLLIALIIVTAGRELLLEIARPVNSFWLDFSIVWACIFFASFLILLYAP